MTPSSADPIYPVPRFLRVRTVRERERERKKKKKILGIFELFRGAFEKAKEKKDRVHPS